MVDLSTQAVAKKPRETGDWRGWPHFMIFVTAVLIAAGIIGGFGIGSEHGLIGWAFFIGCEGSAFVLYSLTAIIAAARGILNR